MPSILKFYFLFLITSLNTVAALSQTILPGTFLQTKHEIQELRNDSIREIIFHPSIKYPSSNRIFQFFNPIIQSSYNSTYARSYNDGGVWKGKGFTQEFHGGFSFTKGVLRLSLLPNIFISQNNSFDLASINQFKNKFNYQFRQMAGSSANIDYVQKYGNKPFVNFNLGQSEVQISTKNIVVGISSQNFTLGPARKNHLLMSNGGQGFPFLYITSPKIKLRIKNLFLGYLQPMLFYGLLKESDYFDEVAENDQRYINGLSLGYELPNELGISIGFSKVLYKNMEAFELQDLYSPFYIADDGIELNYLGDTTKNTGNDTFDQLASAFIQWKVPGQDMRLFFELGKNDFTGGFRWTATEFEHNRLYTLGLEKIWKIKNGEFYFLYEHTYLPFFKNYVYRKTNSSYTHTEARQGYTHNGQLLGPGIGPGSVSDFVDINWIKEVIFGISFQRIRFDEDYFITQIPNNDDKIDRHDVEYSASGKFINKGKKITWGVNSTISYRFNTYFIKKNDKVNGYIQFFINLNLASISEKNAFKNTK